MCKNNRIPGTERPLESSLVYPPILSRTVSVVVLEISLIQITVGREHRFPVCFRDEVKYKECIPFKEGEGSTNYLERA